MIVGVRAPVLLLPEGFARYTENEIRAALCHELAHIQRRDYLMNVACQVAALPLVWHPAADWVQQRIRMTREMVCDAMAAQEMKSQLGYAKCLLALAHSMLGGRGMAAQTQFTGLFGNNTLEERVMRLMDTTTISVRAKAARAVSGAAMMIATGVIAGMFHVTPTMAQANLPPQVAQNPPAVAQTQTSVAPGPTPSSANETVTHGATSHATVNKRNHPRRDVGNGECRALTPAEQRRIDKEVQQRMDEAQRQVAEAMAKVNGPEFQKRMGDAQRQMAEAMARLNDSKFKQQMDDAQRQMAEATARLNSPEFKQRMDDAQRRMAGAMQKANSPEFKHRMDDMQRQMAEATAQLNGPEFKQRMEDAQRQMAEAMAKVNSPEFKERMDDLQKQLQQQMEEFSRKYPHSPNP